MYFNPRSPWGERPVLSFILGIWFAISIHAPRGGSDRGNGSEIVDVLISIHAPRGGSDLRCKTHNANVGDFNPRSPWGERPGLDYRDLTVELFQSTLPVGGATRKLSPLSGVILISIHAPRGGSDHGNMPVAVIYLYFNPRSPWGERLCKSGLIEINGEFQSTLPVGGATTLMSETILPRIFQSTLPVGGATLQCSSTDP